jgi:hypothetical protein
VYGIIAGAVFVVGVPAVGLELGSITVAAGLGLVYGLILMVGGMFFWMRTVIGMDPDKNMMVMFGAVHVIYGLVLGGLLGAGVLG